ncbi:Rossmann-like and DUF2520 domain-containing protein [Enteractinococcus coprophilus]|uniref:Putative short-subunit dehydrogenase-like oxidoreductase (DUF2520 family) n=1 Tax=Enteractinococcus coprophilus TaxID=1027633 RepID=A0A543API0_9MICC|nr:DUF2520 domain-containing protein [Enteractinococcus coprophilus]TQL74493.1 putative short-subunit dehydrogenase-like oxidoreductase (DUF2520 family) [Enteractinococcus coprophilus]
MSVDEPLTTGAIGRPNRLGIGIIGAGRVGGVLGLALQQAGHTITAVHAVSEASIARAEALLPNVSILDIPDILRRSEAVIFAVPDDVLEDLVSGLAAAGHIQTGHLLVHTSGRYGTNVMRSVREHGAIPVAIHPAMTFTGTSLDVDRLHNTAFGITADAVVAPIAEALVVEMGGIPVSIPEAARPVYHAAMAHASNHLVTLTAQAQAMLASAGIDQASKLLGNLMSASLENALTNGDQALTGPVSRGDSGTVAKHLETLKALDDGELYETYRVMAYATAQRAHSAGFINATKLEELLKLLKP